MEVPQTMKTRMAIQSSKWILINNPECLPKDIKTSVRKRHILLCPQHNYLQQPIYESNLNIHQQVNE